MGDFLTSSGLSGLPRLARWRRELLSSHGFGGALSSSFLEEKDDDAA